ncbi:MAG TPA: maltose/maltodextrin transport permease-like protein, partial [Bacteroidetes bacterium]|nr:maltose/maltodextrin transport permease-like protein [Bacteroidota bacterium]
MNSDKSKQFIAFLVVPSFVLLAAVVFYPFFYNLLLAFGNMNLTKIRDWQFIGLRQFIKIFTEPSQPDFYAVFGKTIIWTVVNVSFHVFLGVFLALLLNQKIRGKSIYRTLLILPWAIPQYIVALTWRGMFNYEYGSINAILTRYLSLPAVEWLRSPTEAFLACVITNVWLGFPFMMVVALGALQSIPHELYEAAEIDGASSWHKLKTITIPLIKPVMIPAITLGIVWTFNNLNIVWLVSNGGEPSDNTHILVSFVYKAAFNYYSFSYAAALSLVIFLLLFVFSMVFMRQSKATEPA